MKKAPLNVRRKTREAAKKVEKTAKLGSGKRFAAVEKAAAASGARNPAAVAAAIGRKKYGSKKMATMAAKGRRKARSK